MAEIQSKETYHSLEQIGKVVGLAYPQKSGTGTLAPMSDEEKAKMRKGIGAADIDDVDVLEANVNSIINGNDIVKNNYPSLQQGRFYTPNNITAAKNYAWGKFDELAFEDKIYFDSSKYRLQFLLYEGDTAKGQTGWITSSPYVIPNKGKYTVYVNVNNADGSTSEIIITDADKSVYTISTTKSKLLQKKN